MCGIVGYWNYDGCPVNQQELDQFTDRLAHRGPDGRGTFIDSEAHLGLGHRRLAILDLSESGKQPMCYEGRYWITFNGEIYNFIELKKELESMGYIFTTKCDTEIILAAYAKWGPECQCRFNGMWAFAIWDAKEHSLFLSRDRFGVKPLHFISNKERFAFASEMKAFLSLAWFKPQLDEEVIARNLIDPESIEATEDCLFKNVRRLKAGYQIYIKRDKEPVFKRWWNTLDNLENVPIHYEDQTEKYKSIFMDACKIRMRSDVPMATALSGGMDSSSVVCAVNQMQGTTSVGGSPTNNYLKAFVASYPNTQQDEIRYAQAVIKYTGIQAVVREIKASDIVDSLKEYIYGYEDIQDVHIGTWLLYREMKQSGLHVSLEGHGADETLAGYVKYPQALLEEEMLTKRRISKLLELSTIIKRMNLKKNNHMHDWNVLKWFLLTESNFISGCSAFVKRLSNQKKAKGVLMNNFLRIAPKNISSDSYDKSNDKLSQMGTLNQKLYYDFHFRSLPTILRNIDRCSMAHGIEVRSPFMDWRLVCYSFSLPTEAKIMGCGTKRILRDAMRKVLPNIILQRYSKVGFSNPMSEWMKRPKMKTFILDTVCSDMFLNNAIWNGKKLSQIIELLYRQNKSSQIIKYWIFIQAAHFMKRFDQER